MKLIVNRNPSPSDLRKFGLAMVCGFGVIAVLLWRAGGAGASPWAWSGGAQQKGAIALGILGMVLCAAAFGPAGPAKGVYIAWMSAAAAIGAVMIPLFLTLLFFLLLPIFSLIRFADPLRLKLRREGSYWEPHKRHEPTLERMLRPF